MTRYAIVADLNRCVGCQTCTSACKHANDTAPGVQWRKVLDVESGRYPDVRRTFVPVGCMHCDEPPCMDVCPSTATRKRDDGIVTIDYDICIGCAYCSVSCPYQARFKVQKPNYAFGGKGMRHEKLREDPARYGVAQKCTFCVDKVASGLASGLTPGVDTEATPACVNSCIANALSFGDIDDPASNVSKLVAENQHFRMHEEVGTGPNIYYLWEQGSEGSSGTADEPLIETTGAHMPGVEPRMQTDWDLRAAGNFMGGGTGTGLYAATALAAAFGLTGLMPMALLALALVGAGLFLVWLEIGRPWRFLNVFRNPQTSWMSREAYVAMVFLGLGFLAILLDHTGLALLSAALGLIFLYCQARILHASKGIPGWREPALQPLILATGLCEGTGLLVASAAFLPGIGGLVLPGCIAFLILLGLRFVAWRGYISALSRSGAPQATMRIWDSARFPFAWLGHAAPAVLVVAGLLLPAFGVYLAAIGGLLALSFGWLFKLTLVTNAAYNQGFSIVRTPARGSGTSGPGIKPGWTSKSSA